MESNYFLLIIILLTIIFKALADGYNYKFNTEKNETLKIRYGIIYHIFGVFAIGIPILSILITDISKHDFIFVLTGFSLIYFGLFDLVYNIVAGKNWEYIGKTDIIDRLLRKIFNKTPFLKSVHLGIKWLFLGIGIAFILELI